MLGMLVQSIEDGHINLLGQLLDTKIDPNTKINHFPLLHIAVKSNQLSCVQTLLDKKADPMKRHKFKCDAPWFAGVFEKNYPCLELLLLNLPEHDVSK